MKSLKNGCINSKTKVINGIVKVGKRIGQESVYGEVYEGCYSAKKDCSLKIAIKKIPFTRELISNIDTELTIINLANFLLKKKVSPHLPVVFGSYICKRDKSILVTNELAIGDLKYFMTEVKPSVKIMRRLYFQIFTGIYVMKKYFGINHNDLHWGNVLIHKVRKENSYTRYKINGKYYYIKNYGYIPVLWDFGLSIISGNKANLEDYHRIISMLSKDSEQTSDDYDSLGKELETMLNKSKNIYDFFDKNSSRINEKENNIRVTQDYNLDKKVTSKDPMIKNFLVG